MVASLWDHVTQCPYSLIPCPNTCMDETQNVRRLVQKDLEWHLRSACLNRDYECKYCGEKGTYLSIKVHGNNCGQKIVPCPNAECEEDIERLHIQEHVEEHCPHTEVPCKYTNVGCNVTLKRGLIEEHEQDDVLHLHTVMDTVVNLQKAITTLKERTDTLPARDFVTFKLVKYESNRRRNKTVMSPSFYTSPNGYKLSLKIYPNGHGEAVLGSHVSVYMHILEGEYDQALNWPLVGSITIELLNQLTDKSHHTKTLRLRWQDNARAADDKGWGYTSFLSLSALARDEVGVVQFLRGDCLYFRISVKVAESKPWLEYNLLSPLSYS